MGTIKREDTFSDDWELVNLLDPTLGKSRKGKKEHSLPFEKLTEQFAVRLVPLRLKKKKAPLEDPGPKSQ